MLGRIVYGKNFKSNLRQKSNQSGFIDDDTNEMVQFTTAKPSSCAQHLDHEVSILIVFTVRREESEEMSGTVHPVCEM